MLFQDYVCSRDKEKEVAISNMPVPISQPGKWLPGNDLCWPRITEMVDWLLLGLIFLGVFNPLDEHFFIFTWQPRPIWKLYSCKSNNHEIKQVLWSVLIFLTKFCKQIFGPSYFVTALALFLSLVKRTVFLGQ